MEENNIRKASLPEETLEQVNAGNVIGGYNMKVGNCGGGYIELYRQPNGQCYALARLCSGYQVTTFGRQNTGIDQNGESCTFTYVCWKGVWGWVVSDFLRR